MPAERRGDWLRRAQTDFQGRRATCEQLIGDLAEAREQLAQEATLIDARQDARGTAWSLEGEQVAGRVHAHARPWRGSARGSVGASSALL